MKKIILLMFCMIFLIGIVSAWGPDNFKDYNEANKEILITNFFGLGDDLAKYKLTYNTDQCMINCRAEGEAVLYKDGYLFTDLRFKNTKDAWTSIQESKIYIWTTETYEKPYHTYEELCFDINSSGKVCDRYVNGTYNGTKYNSYWKEYKGEYLDAGNYKWKITGKKNSIGERIDWIGSAFGEDFEEWAWWNSNWLERRQINITGGNSLIENFTLYMRVAANESIQPDFDDLRFIDGSCEGNQTLEMDADLEHRNSSAAFVWVRMENLSTGTDQICMYFNNSGATANWNSNATWNHGGSGTFSLIYHLTLGDNVTGSDSAGNTDIQSAFTSGTPDSSANCFFGRCYSFDKENNDAFVANSSQNASVYTIALWGFMEEFTDNQRWLGNQPTGPGLDDGEWEMLLTANALQHSLEATGGAVEVNIQAEASQLNLNEFGFVVVTQNGAVRNTYWNGEFVATTSTPNVLSAGFAGIGGVFRGGAIRTGGFTINGSLDEVWYFNNTILNNETIERYAQQNNSNLVVFGAEEQLGDFSVSVTLNSPANNSKIFIPTATFNASHLASGGSLVNTTLRIFLINGNIISENFTTLTGTSNTTNLTIASLSSNVGYLWNYETCANNATTTLCNMDPVNRSFDILSFQTNVEAFANDTIEGSTEFFQINITTLSGFSVLTANLFYNNVSSSGSVANTGGSNFSISESIVIPNVGSVTNLSFFWNIILNDLSSQNSTSNTQSVSPLNADDCTNNTVRIFNFTLVDEETQDVLVGAAENTTIELALMLFSSDRNVEVLNFSNLFNNTNPVEICLDINLTSQTSFVVDLVVRYEATDYANEYFNIINSTLDNNTQQQDIILFDLLSSDSTEFRITFLDSNFLPVETALVFIERQYVAENNTFKTVELPTTDANGQTVGHFVRNDVVYNIRVVKDGVVLGNFENIIAFCDDITIGKCEIPLNAISAANITFSYDESVGLIASPPIFNSTTSIMSFNFATATGSAETVTMSVSRNDVFGNRSLCNNTLSAPSGTLACVVNPAISDTLLVTTVTVNGNTALLTQTPINTSNFGSIGFAIWFILSLFIILMMGDTKTGIFLGMIVSYIGAVTMGLIERTIVGVGAAGIWILVITIMGLWKLNKENPQ